MEHINRLEYDLGKEPKPPTMSTLRDNGVRTRERERDYFFITETGSRERLQQSFVLVNMKKKNKTSPKKGYQSEY